MKFFRPGLFLRFCYPGAIFRIGTKEKVLYLTFDDGPNPDSTEKLIGILGNYGIKGVFFCSGKAAAKYPDQLNTILKNGHVIGNHGFSHLDGCKTADNIYLSDIREASKYIDSRLFRPPYGHLTFRQFRLLKKEFSVFFWDVMPFDYDRNFSREKSLAVLKKKIRPGSVIVLHDTPASVSSFPLTDFIGYALNNGYRFGLPK